MLREKFDLFIFDLDGTIIESHKDLTSSVNHVRSLYDLKPLDISQVIDCIGTGVKPLLEKTVPGIPLNEIDTAVDSFQKYYGEHLLDATVVYPDIHKIFEILHDKKKVVLTNKPEGFSNTILKGLNIDRHFLLVWGGDTGPKKKPHPEPVNEILQKFNIKPEKAVMIGDSKTDINTAKAAGISSVALGYGYNDPNVLKSLKPEYFVSSTKELLNII